MQLLPNYFDFLIFKRLIESAYFFRLFGFFAQRFLLHFSSLALFILMVSSGSGYTVCIVSLSTMLGCNNVYKCLYSNVVTAATKWRHLANEKEQSLA